MARHHGTKVTIMIGSNTGDRKSHIDNAVEALREYVGGITVTHDIDNPDFTGVGPDYLNRLLSGTTALPLERLKTVVKAIETRLGRDRRDPAIVAIDIDIVVYGDTIIKPSEYTSPPCRRLLPALNAGHRST